jgi:exosortase K
VSRGLAFFATLAFAYAAKAWYAGADADALAWILGPTAWLVEAISGHVFEVEPGMGYLSREPAFLIAPVCAGVNYFVIAFTTLALGFAPSGRAPVQQVGWLLGAAALAFAATLVVNATRIALALGLQGAPLPPGLSAEEAHRVLGVLVYLGALLVLVLGVSRLVARRPDAGRVAALACGLYLAVTIVVPWLRGAGVEPAFWDHARSVAVTTLALALLLATAAAAAARVRSQASARRRCRPPPGPRA